MISIHYQNPVVKHSVHCSSVDCFLDKKVEHVAVFHFDTDEATYYAQSLHDAAVMWVEGGMKQLNNVGKQG